MRWRLPSRIGRFEQRNEIIAILCSDGAGLQDLVRDEALVGPAVDCGTVADYLRDYAATFELPVRLNTRVNRLHKLGVKGAETIAINTDKVHLDIIEADKKLLIGKSITRGLGAGGYPEVAERCADLVADLSVHAACAAAPPPGRQAGRSVPPPAGA